ncbi:hypothetical protein M0804_001337 [Polistes exclamans]|nr:hypothetical protein M0804_001337 [Polistes exclamans]
MEEEEEEEEDEEEAEEEDKEEEVEEEEEEEDETSGWTYTYHGDCLCWLMATYTAHTSHYEAVLDPHEPLLSPWPQRRRVMANTLRIKCILSLFAPYTDGTDASAPY